MRGVTWGVVGMVAGGMLSGCRSATRVVETPRVDLQLSGGNHGYLIGSAPPPTLSPRTTRQVIEAEVEIPSRYAPKQGTASPVSLGEVAPPEVDLSEDLPVFDGGVSETYGTYTVKSGDTLWSIAAQPTVYGNATKWRRLYEANHNLLKSPDQLRVGMTLKVPQAPGKMDSDTASSAESGGDTVYEK